MGYGKQREDTAHIQSLVKLHPWFLSLRWKTCLRQNCSLGSCACCEGPVLGQNTLMRYIYIHTRCMDVFGIRVCVCVCVFLYIVKCVNWVQLLKKLI